MTSYVLIGWSAITLCDLFLKEKLLSSLLSRRKEMEIEYHSPFKFVVPRASGFGIYV